MEKIYDPSKMEEKIYKLWGNSSAFTPRKSKKKKPFCIIMPPPNANAPLHIGHAMFVTLEDLIIRFSRLNGFSALWLPGTDHAGILTQVVFERKLAKEGKTRFDLARKKFYQECYRFTQKNKKIMYQQIKKLGASCDWRREKFTLDKKISREVLSTFVQLYKDCLVFRGTRMINWCPRCMTTLSDLEVEYITRTTPLYFIRYGPFVVATTRPETKFGDTALAIHPEDERYKRLIDQEVKVKDLLGEFKLKVIADKSIDPEFGTGVVKVTPAHDFSDYELGQRHNLAVRQVIDLDGKLNFLAGPYQGLAVEKAREKIAQDLRRVDLLIKTKKNYSHRIARCERCKMFIEPMISKQWFIKTSSKLKVKSPKLKKLLGVKKASLGEMGILAVRKGLIRIIPKRFEKIYFNWLTNLHDWCISRQLWWGQQLPVWYCGPQGLSELQRAMNPELLKVKSHYGCGHTIISLKKPTKCPECGNKNIIQDPDTLDTWFSSGQWPYTALGFSSEKKTKQADFDYWYPTTVLETGYEILFHWVARMITLSLYRTKEIPFKLVYLHGMVRDVFGKKMSKSLGNVIDPLDVIKKYGADALRMALVVGALAGNDISLSEEKIKGYRNFCNKIWNAARFVITNRELKTQKLKLKTTTKSLKRKLKNKNDKWIIKKLEDTIKKTTEALEQYRFSQAGEILYEFFWHKFCDRYIEAVKPRLNLKAKSYKLKAKKELLEDRKVALVTLIYVLKTSLILLHPFIPFVTEAVWQKIKSRSEPMLISSDWPKV